PHDFFTPQPSPTQHTSVSFFRNFFRNIIHDWPESYCRRILRHIVDAMSSQSRIVVMDVVM
ncbi:hypothetical protein K432DRAFT_261328, partial [Lepidopterella palustris CBS 459.81]